MGSIPLMLLPLIAYNILAIVFGAQWNAEVTSLPMMSGAVWTMTAHDVFLLCTLFVLFIEILKSSRASHSSVLEHILSTIVFVICIVEFLLVDRAATSTFFLMTVISFVDVVAGFSITIRAARRDFSVGTSEL
ncbi:hypothetical protein [Lutibaculum baratangense]|uniref:Transmembrane protein n=1 Tax=Lutibaculum baratangense AMV1 TaxID=631454 RepID=V4RF90_9HYPH|nr:hypothetical protein [Lutibaculum baratangense]ESR24034.1 hypothetical protein N177_2483 [Lutibaculum baratangense AMV1]